MRYLSLFFFLFLSLHSYFVFSQTPAPVCEGSKNAKCLNTTPSIYASCQANGWPYTSSTAGCGSTGGQPNVRVVCYSSCTCPAPFVYSWENGGGCVEPEPEPEECEAPLVKNIETGNCEAKTECVYPQLYDSFSNSCYANPNNCAIGAKPNPLEPGTCVAYGETSCGSGWVPINDGLNCAPDPNASSSGNASSAAPASSSGNASSTPTSTPSNPSSTPSTGGDGDGDGDGSSGSGSGGGGDGSTGGTGGSGSASSSNSSGAGSGNGSGGAGECDPTAKNYLDCISEETGDEGDGLDEINQQDYSLNIAERLQQARDNYTDRLNDIKDDLTQELSVSLGAGSGSLPSDRIELYGQTVEMGIYARKDFFDAIRWIFLAVASVVSLYIVLSKGD